ncbi:class I SAM-dependent methyltransferase [Nitrosopumilus sp.]|uniref:class I SAM-dependent methyltransferase n=1 Tax=Nitrosopumilus sp. TaxID=2024843 RepID=UPI003D0A4F6A
MNNDELENFKESFPGWDDYYKETDVQTMPWYEKNLDHDVENEIKSKNYNSGSFLDLGTGPGTQAIELSKYGFIVTGTDISQHAIDKAQKLSDKVHFLVDDVLNSKLPDCKFDFIFDRGVFHVFDVSQRSQYVKQIIRILNDNGILFLKCMSINEKNLPDNDMPHKISQQEIVDSFRKNFNIEKFEDSVFRGTLEFEPKALFTVLKKK